MSYLTRIVRLINLLCTRQVVSMSSIRKICGLPERTAYRQLQQISEAGFPVYYDRYEHVYRLHREGAPNLSLIGPDDASSILTSLMLLRSRVNESYREELENLIGWLISSSSLQFENVLPLLRNRAIDSSQDKDLSEFLSEIRLRVALESKRQVQIVTNAGVTETGGESVRSFSLRHNGSWYVVTGNVEDESWNELSSVIRVSIGNADRPGS